MDDFMELKSLIEKNIINLVDTKLNGIIQNYAFYQKNELISDEENQEIIQNIKESEVMAIGKYQENISNELFYIISFKKTIILINQSCIINFQHFFSCNPNLTIYFLHDVKDIFIQQIKIQNSNFECDSILNNEIFSFVMKMTTKTKLESSLYKIWKSVRSCIAGYLIRQGYSKVDKKQTMVFSKIKNDSSNEGFDENEYIELRLIGSGSCFQSILIYHIEKDELFVIKKPYGSSSENEILIEREVNNYLKLNYPLIPKFYGKVKNKRYPIIQFINGQTLTNIKKLNLCINDKITIICEILMIINYLHEKEFIYRDLKPDNVIIDKNKNVFLIDFDRMIKYSNTITNEIRTADFATTFIAPEINYGHISFKNDIYSIGMMMSYIINEEIIQCKKIWNNTSQLHFVLFENIYNICIDKQFENRLPVSDLLFIFITFFISEINLNYIGQDQLILYTIGEIYFLASDYFKSNLDKFSSQVYEIMIHFITVFIKPDFNKAIHYLTLSANQNNQDAQFKLGMIYYDGQYITQDINKSIYYLTLAANQNNQEAQFKLGMIYYDGQYITQDINKSIYYFTLAANQNFPEAQYNLGHIYIEGKYIEKNINKSFHYFSLAANQNYPDAQYFLGILYFYGDFIAQDIKKAIHYFTLAADQHNSSAQNFLGNIYYEGTHVIRNISKAVHYLTLAANQHNSCAQYKLGVIYYKGKYIKKKYKQSYTLFDSCCRSI